MVVSLLRKEARQNLKEKWKKAILIMFIYFIISMVSTIIVYLISANTPYGVFATILNIIITVSLNYGVLASFMKLKRNKEVTCFHVLYYAIRDLKKVWKVLGKLILKLLPYIIVLILFLYLMITEFVSLSYGKGMRLSYIVEILAVILFSILLSMKALYYSLNNYILYDNREYKAKEILKESERLMKNHRWDFVKMNLSFAGWFLLAVLFSTILIAILFFICNFKSVYITYIAYIPLVFLLPYIQITNICFYDNLVHNNPKSKENVINNKKKKTSKKK